jgi:hypothetical protein
MLHGPMERAAGELAEQERDPLEETARFELHTPEAEEPPPPPPTAASGRHRIRIVPITPAPAITYVPPPASAQVEAPDDDLVIVDGPPIIRSKDRPRCPYCHEDLAPEMEKAGCQSCLAWHHAACWHEAGGRCATCGRKRVSDARRRPGLRWTRAGAALALALVGVAVAWRGAARELERARAQLVDAWRERSNLQYEVERARREAARARTWVDEGPVWSRGATRAEVVRLQGQPDDVQQVAGDQIYRYGESTVTFSFEGRVIAFTNRGNLLVR